MEDLVEEDKRSIELSIEGDQQSITSSISSLELSLPTTEDNGLTDSLGSSLGSLDISVLSGSLDDLSGSSEIETESRESVSSKPEDWGDKIIRLFIAKRRVLLMDQDQEQDGLISFEQSEERVNTLLGILAVLFWIISIILLRIILDRFKSHNELTTTIKMDPNLLLFLEPKLSILDKSSGQLTTLAWNNESLKPDWQIKLPKSHLKDFFPYYDSRALNIIYGSNQHDMTYIDVASSGKCHRVLPDSRFGHFFNHFSLESVRVGKFIIFFGGYSVFDNPHFEFQIDNRNKENRKVFLWHTQRHKWYKWYDLPSGFGGRMCGIGVNDTTAVLFGMMQPIHDTVESLHEIVEDGYLKKITLYLWDEKNPIQVDPYFHEFANLKDKFFASQLDFDCATMFTKTSDM